MAGKNVGTPNTSYLPQQPMYPQQPFQPPQFNQQQYPPQYQQQPPDQPNWQQQSPMNQYQQWQIQGQFTKSYTTPAVITLVLYIFLWVPGLIANIVYLVEANKTKKITRIAPDGYGCLIAMLCVVAAPPALFVLLVIFITMVGAHSHP